MSSKEREIYLRDFKTEFERLFEQSIPLKKRLDKFQNLEKEYPILIKQFKGNFYGI